MSLDTHIFRAYDIRGDVRSQLTPDVVFDIGRALAAAHFPPKSRLLIGRDARETSPQLAQKLIDGLRLQGVDIIDLGAVTTPMLYFAQFRQPDAQGAVMVTGSHNPIHDNGLKICKKNQSFLRNDIAAVLEKMTDLPAPAQTPGTYAKLDIADAYEQAILSLVRPKRKLKLVIDAGNGVAGPFALRILSHFADTIEPLYCTPDGAFPNHHPDPSVPENMKDCKAAVCDTHADLGLAFDGDGDRLGVVDSDGTLIPADRLIAVFARDILSRTPNATILADVKCSKLTFDDIKNHGGIPHMTKTGHALIKADIAKNHAAFAGEMSGHFFFSEPWFGFDDALFAASRLCEIVANTNQSIAERLADLPKTFATPELRFDCPDDIKFDIPKKIADCYRDIYPVCTLDGARIDFPQGWALVRASNTQPVLVIRVEADSRENTQRLLEQIKRDIQNHCSLVLP